MDKYSIIGLTILGLALFYNFKKDKGEHVKAKIIHSVVLTIIVLYYADVYQYIGWLIRDFESTRDKWSIDIGILPSYIIFPIMIIYVALSLIVLLTAFSLSVRRPKAKAWFQIFLPIIAVIESISFYQGWLNSEEQEFNDLTIFLIGLTLCLGIAGIFIYIYNRPYMIEFLENLKEKNDYQQKINAIKTGVYSNRKTMTNVMSSPMT